MLSKIAEPFLPQVVSPLWVVFEVLALERKGKFYEGFQRVVDTTSPSIWSCLLSPKS